MRHGRCMRCSGPVLRPPSPDAGRHERCMVGHRVVHAPMRLTTCCSIICTGHAPHTRARLPCPGCGLPPGQRPGPSVGGRDASPRTTRLSPAPCYPMPPGRACSMRVSVSGGRGRHARSISATAALQLPWQSNTALTMPPLTMPARARAPGQRPQRPAGLRACTRRPPQGARPAAAVSRCLRASSMPGEAAAAQQRPDSSLAQVVPQQCSHADQAIRRGMGASAARLCRQALERCQAGRRGRAATDRAGRRPPHAKAARAWKGLVLLVQLQRRLQAAFHPERAQVQADLRRRPCRSSHSVSGGCCVFCWDGRRGSRASGTRPELSAWLREALRRALGRGRLRTTARRGAEVSTRASARAHRSHPS